MAYKIEFSDLSKVKDASDSVKANIYDFIDNSDSLILVVDCENSYAFKLASVLTQLDEIEIHKIQKIILFDDVHTTNAWNYLHNVTKIPIEHNVIERIKEDKSLVDIKIAMGISKAYYKDNISSFILLFFVAFFLVVFLYLFLSIIFEFNFFSPTFII